jgi:hypothetical protein
MQIFFRVTEHDEDLLMEYKCLLFPPERQELVETVLLIYGGTYNIKGRIHDMQQKNPKRLEILVGVCARLLLIDQICGLSFAGNTRSEKESFLYQIDRLSAYLTTTCIDVVTGEHYQAYDEWLEESYKAGILDHIWKKVVAELPQTPTSDEIGNIFVKWTKELYKKEYNETTSIRKAFMDFVSAREDWLKNWLLQNYIVEELNSKYEPKKIWEAMSDEEKCRNIALYLYALRNLYTHTVNPYQSMDTVQRHNSRLTDKYSVEGIFAIYFPPEGKKKPYRRISLAQDLRESDVIRFLVITWIRAHWLEIKTDDENFIQRYWESRTR